MQNYTTLAICTLVVNWTLSLLAFISVVSTRAFRPAQGNFLPIEEALIYMALVLGVILVSLSTWAIVDEGEGQHQQDILGSQLERAAKVNGCPKVYSSDLIS